MKECIEWTGWKHAKGYGGVDVKTEGGQWVKQYAHRVAYCESRGLSVEDIKGKVVRHKCDNPSCVNPDHLELGTQRDNIHDMLSRGRFVNGERQWQAKLTVSQVKEIREVYAPRCPVNGGVALAKRYGVPPQTISKVVNRKSWRHVK